MRAVSAGLLMYRRRAGELEVLLAHPGGPIFRRRDLGVWTVPKGLVLEGEDLLAAAIREFGEEIGLPVAPPLLSLGSVRQKSGKLVHAWAFEGDGADSFAPQSNEFEVEWPPRSGTLRRFPEVDRAEFFSLPTAAEKIIAAQAAFLERLRDRVNQPST